MQVFINLDLLDELVSQRQTRIREAVQATRRCGPGNEAAGEHPVRTWIGDRLIAWGQSIRGGMPSRPMANAEGSQKLAPRPVHEPARTG